MSIKSLSEKLTRTIAAAALMSAVLCPPASGALNLGGPHFRADAAAAPPVKEREYMTDMMDAIQVKVKTRATRGAGTAANIFLSICDVVFHLDDTVPGANAADGWKYFLLVFDSPAAGDTTLFSAYPYGYLKFCDIKIWNDGKGRAPGWFPEYVRIYYHLRDEGLFNNGQPSGWYRYMSPRRYFEERDRWTGEYRYPYNGSEPSYLQYFGTYSAGNRWLALTQHSCPTCDLSYTDLEKAELTGDFTRANFTGAKLEGASFTGATLTEATFAKADISETNLSGQRFAHADFHGAKMHDTDLAGADLTGAVFSHIDGLRVNLSGAILAGADLSHTMLLDSNLSGVDFTGVRMDWKNDEIYGRTDFGGSNLQNATLAGLDLNNASFPGVDLRGANMRGAAVKSLRRFLDIRTNSDTICPGGKPGPCNW